MRYDSLTDLGFSAGEPAGNRNGMEGSDPDNAIVLGIDPGLSGAICLMNHDGVLLVEDLPTHTAQHGSRAKTRAELDLHTLRQWLVGHQLRDKQMIAHCYLEKVDARPGQGVVSMFRFGQSLGGIYGLLVGLSLPVTFVLPQRWQKFHGIGPSPDAARQRAVQLYPKLAELLEKKRDQHRADAVLLAAFGLSQVLSGPRA